VTSVRPAAAPPAPGLHDHAARPGRSLSPAIDPPDPGGGGVYEPRDDGEEEVGLPRAASRLEERRSDQEVRAERRKERRLLLQVAPSSAPPAGPREADGPHDTDRHALLVGHNELTRKSPEELQCSYNVVTL